MRQSQQKLRYWYFRRYILAKFTWILIVEEKQNILWFPPHEIHCHFLVLFLSRQKEQQCRNAELHPHRYCSFLCSYQYKVECTPLDLILSKEIHISSLPFLCILHLEKQMIDYKFRPGLLRMCEFILRLLQRHVHSLLTVTTQALDWSSPSEEQTATHLSHLRGSSPMPLGAGYPCAACDSEFHIKHWHLIFYWLK